MGTHNYIVETRLKNAGEFPTISSLTFNNMAMNGNSDIGDFIDFWGDESYDGEGYFLYSSSCRVILLEECQYMWDAVFFKDKYNSIAGVRCFGEMHTDVSALIRANKGGSKIMEEFFNKIFGVTMTLKCGYFRKYNSDYFLGRMYLNYITEDGVKQRRNSNGHITMYFKSWENEDIRGLPLLVSAMIGILREPVICKGILIGEITDRLSLADAFIKLAEKRIKRTDKSYCCFALGDVAEHHTMEEKIENIKNALMSELNDDGSDWLSLIGMALFCYNVSPNSMSSDEYLDAGGPIEYATDNYKKSAMKRLYNAIEDKSSMHYIAKHFEELAAQDYFPEDFDDEDKMTLEKFLNSEYTFEFDFEEDIYRSWNEPKTKEEI